MQGTRQFYGAWVPIVTAKRSLHQGQRAWLRPSFSWRSAFCQRAKFIGSIATNPNWRAPQVCSSWPGGVQLFHSSPTCRGLEEFFPKTDDVIEEGEHTGNAWLARILRQKSNEDLHKLWYVLLKERNLLLTLKQEAKRAGFIMPAPERMWKVRKSMARIKLVINEREKAIAEAKRVLEGTPEIPKETYREKHRKSKNRKQYHSIEGERDTEREDIALAK